MTQGQSALGDFASEDSNLRKSAVGGTHRRSAIALERAPENAEPLDDLSCPWCLGPKSDFEITERQDGNRKVSCPNCNAVIPTSADWYLRGEKICL